MQQTTTLPRTLTPTDRQSWTHIADNALALVIQKVKDGVANPSSYELLAQLASLYQSRRATNNMHLEEMEALDAQAHHLLSSTSDVINRLIVITVEKFAEAEYYADGSKFFTALGYACNTINRVNGEHNKTLQGLVRTNAIETSEQEQRKYWETIIALLNQQLARSAKETDASVSTQNLFDEAEQLVKMLSRDAERWE